MTEGRLKQLDSPGLVICEIVRRQELLEMYLGFIQCSGFCKFQPFFEKCSIFRHSSPFFSSVGRQEIIFGEPFKIFFLIECIELIQAPLKSLPVSKLTLGIGEIQ